MAVGGVIEVTAAVVLVTTMLVVIGYWIRMDLDTTRTMVWDCPKCGVQVYDTVRRTEEEWAEWCERSGGCRNAVWPLG